MEYINESNLRLEVLTPPEGLQNLILNPDGVNGAWSWQNSNTGLITVAGGGLTGTCVTAGATSFYSQMVKVTAGNYIAAQLNMLSLSTSCSIRLNVTFWKADRTTNGTATATTAITATGVARVNSFLIPANTAYAQLVIFLYHSTTSTTNASVGDFVVWKNAMVTTNTTNTFGTIRTNLFTNPSAEVSASGMQYFNGALNGSSTYGSVTRTTAQHYVGSASFKTTVSSSGPGTYYSGFNTAKIPVVGGKDYSLSFQSKADTTTRTQRMMVYWYKSDGTQISQAPYTLWFNSTSGWVSEYQTLTAPSNAATVQIAVFVQNGSGANSTLPDGETHYYDAFLFERSNTVKPYFDGDSVAAGYTYAWSSTAGLSTSTESNSTWQYVDPYANWQNVLGPTTDISVKRAAFDVGTLTATIVDPDVDPALAASPLDIGTDIRLSALVPATGTWETVFYGTIGDVQVSYTHDGKDLRTIVSVQAEDAFAYWSQQLAPGGVKNISDLRAIFQDSYLAPYSVNGNGDRIRTLLISDYVAINADAVVTDQIALTRDSNGGYAWVSRNGVMNVWDGATLIALGTTPLTFDDSITAPTATHETFSDASASYNTDDICNIVNLTYTTKKYATQPITIQVVDQNSVDLYGAFQKDWTAQALTSTQAATLASSILAQNATPVRKINSITYPVRDDYSLEHAATYDLYDRANFNAFSGKFDGTTDYFITGIEHSISVRAANTTEWTTTYETSIFGGLASPKRVAHKTKMRGAVPSISRYRVNDLGIPTSTLMTVIMSTTVIPDQGITDDGAGNFTLPTDGTYRVDASLMWDNTASTGRREISVYVNGTQVARQAGINVAQANQTTSINYVFAANEGDTVSIRTWQTSGSNLNIIGGQVGTYLQIYRMGD